MFALWQIVLDPKAIEWWGALIACSPMSIFIANLFLSRQGRAAARMRAGLFAAIIGFGLCVISFNALAIGLSLCVGVIGILLYDYWYSPLKRAEKSILAVGGALKEFYVFNSDGEQEYNSEWRGKPFFLIVIRGNWCPLCVAQIDEMAKLYRQIADKGVDIKVVAAQSLKETKKLAARFDVPMQFYTDLDQSLANNLGLLHKNGVGAGLITYKADTLLPSVILCDEQLKIRYVDLTDNYRVRPDPQQLLEALNQA